MNINKDFDPESYAKELGLTPQQKSFCEFFLYLTGLDGPLAAEMAGYQVKYDDVKYTQAKQEYYKRLTYGGIATRLLSNKNVLLYIKYLRDQMETSLVIDKLYVTQKLKSLAETGVETVQLKALELLGKSLEMFTDKSKIEGGIDDPAKIAKEAMEKRKAEMKIYKEGTDD